MIALDDRRFGPWTGHLVQGANVLTSISRAREIAAHTRSHSIADVEHVVVLTLGNRSFDHYFETLPGVRGFSDRRRTWLPAGDPQWPKRGANIDLDCCSSMHAGHGLLDAKSGRGGKSSSVAAMSYFARVERPFFLALANAFTICDAYYATAFDIPASDGTQGGSQERGDTNLETCLLKPGEYGALESIFNGLDRQALTISSVTYHDGEPARQEVCDSVFDVLREDVLCARLAQVSWISLPDIKTMGNNQPSYDNAWDVAQVLDALTANPDVWSRTVLFVNAAPADCHSEHLVPVGPFAVNGETKVGRHDPRLGNFSEMHLRVPMWVVSPWSRGGYVNAQVFDHSSVMRFIERRFGRYDQSGPMTKITPWHASVAGDLTSAFNFGRPNAALSALPSTQFHLPALKACDPDGIGLSARAAEPVRQERGIRRARALPYRLEARGMLQPMADNFVIEFSNRGQVAAVFRVSATGSNIAPSNYTVEAGNHLKHSWALNADGRYDFSVHGPNGFLRTFKGRVLAAHDALLEAHIECRHEGNKELILSVANFGTATKTIRILDSYTGEVSDASLSPDDILTRSYGCMRQFGWYDLRVTSDEDANFCWQFAGHIENGRDSISDPDLGRRMIDV